MDFTYVLNETPIVTAVDGEVHFGDPVVLLDQDDDLSRGTEWADKGYTVVPFLEPILVRQLRDGMRDMIVDVLRAAGVQTGGDFDLRDYHRGPGRDPAIHAKLVDGIRRGFPLTRLPVDYHVVERRISEIVGARVTAHNEAFGLDVFNLRVVRPQTHDNNPLHRDVWLDRLRNGINIYAPLTGSTERSSLALVPGSHRWAENEIQRTANGALVNGLPYTVPAVVGARHPLALIRPNPAEDEVMVFSPYLVHGGAVNLNPDTTRVSLEMRFWRKQ
jgi:hypothetical protein